MPAFAHSSQLRFPAEEVFAWHARPGAIDRLCPPWQARVIESAGGLEVGARKRLEFRVGPLKVQWESLHTDHEPGRLFRDEQVRGPFRKFSHLHRFVPDGPDRCTVEDLIEYELPAGRLGGWLAGGLVRESLRRAFVFRHQRLRHDLQRHRAAADRGPLRVVISGATGFIGRNLAAFLASGGHRVDRLVRRSSAGGADIEWDPAKRRIDAARLEGAGAVVHLAGENIAAGRWRPQRKESILRSRVESTRFLCETLATLRSPPRCLISASAVGYYGDRGDELLDEHSPPGDGFLAEVCRQWEAAAQPAVQAGIRTVNLRIGMVIGAAGGSLPAMLPPFRLGLGGRVGSGRQWMSWISLDDLVGAIHHLMFANGVSGPVNAVAPEPVTNADFTRTLGRVLRRPAMLAVPAWAIRLALGELGRELLLSSIRVKPAVLLGSGFEFLHPHLELALRTELGRWR